MSFKTLIFFGILAVALSHPLEQLETSNVDLESLYEGGIPAVNDVVLLRSARSPQGKLHVRYEDAGRLGNTGTVDYSHPIGKNLDAYGQVSRNYKFNDNSGHVGMRYRF